MWKPLKVIILNDKNTETNALKLILTFLGEKTDIYTTGSWRRDVPDASEVLCFVIDVDCIATELARVCGTINEFDKSIPIILYSSNSMDESKIEVDDATRLQIITQLLYKADHHQWLNSLHLCQLCRNGEHSFIVPNNITESTSVSNRPLVGKSDTMQNVRKLISQVAQTDANVLILGESGTGKEVVAQNLHALSKRSAEAFVPINCGAIPAELLESELFGHEKGAFTGAITARQGRFELARGGTIFLDEIGDMPMPMQVKLLRVIQERVYERVGGSKTLKVDVRIIAATHRNLEQAVEDGSFREDLYYRLNVFPIEVPALKERPDDISQLINNFSERLQKAGMNKVRFTANALVSLTRHSWPGNVRELANLMERMSILFPEGIVDLAELPDKYKYGDGLVTTKTPQLATANQQPSKKSTLRPIPDDGFNLKEYLVEVEKMYILQALDDCNWVVARAANKLEMRRTTLVEKMRKYEIHKSEESS